MKRGALPLNALRAFESTARLGRMTAAADELGVTYSAISRQIRGLEDMLALPLFEGPRNRLAPTEAALALLPDLTEAFDRIETALNRVTGQERRVLDVSCLGTLTMRWLIPRLSRFQTLHPGIEVRLSSDDGPVDFRRQRIDVAIRVGRGGWGTATVLPLFEDRVGPVLSPSLLPSAGLTRPQDLPGLPLLHTRTRPSAWPDWFRNNGITYENGGRRFEHFYFMLEAATAGLGAAIAPEVLVRDDLAAGRLIAPFGFTPSGQSYVALIPPDSGKDARAFLAWLENTIASEDRPAETPRILIRTAQAGRVALIDPAPGDGGWNVFQPAP